jgi:hypothetical protein
MPILSHLHQLFHAETCHAYTHTLPRGGNPWELHALAAGIAELYIIFLTPVFSTHAALRQ